MALTAKTKIGNTVVEITASDIKDLFQQSAFFAELPSKCTCGSGDIALHHRATKSKKDGNTYDYYELCCKDCKQVFPIGQKKDMKSLYPKGPWQKNNYADNGGEGVDYSPGASGDDDDIPFGPFDPIC